MTYRRFLSYNVIGAAVWVGVLVYAGYLFGNIPWVKNNLTMIVLSIVGISLLPIAVQWLRERRGNES
jgi:membrane-associated protein